MKHLEANQRAGGVVDLIDGLIDQGIHTGASDLHFEPTDAELRVRFRVDGRLHDVESLPISLLPNVVTRLKVMAGLLSYRVDIPQEGGLTLDRSSHRSSNGQERIDLRISTFPTIRGERVAVRLLPRGVDVRSLHELGLSHQLIGQMIAATAEHQGLVLVTGPAGSGKTTTLYALLRHLQETLPGACLMTVEDPVELRLDGIAQIQVAPHGDLTYARALRSLLRQDPQVILIGEIRDAETARIATEAALTGHLILTTMHSGRGVDAIVRLMEMGLPPYQITSTLRLVTCQRLIRTLCDRCHGQAGSQGNGTTGTPCETCLNIGFHGRTACAEPVVMTEAVRSAILNRSDTRTLTQTVTNLKDYVSLSQDAQRHVDAGRTTAEEIGACLTASLLE